MQRVPHHAKNFDSRLGAICNVTQISRQGLFGTIGAGKASPDYRVRHVTLPSLRIQETDTRSQPAVIFRVRYRSGRGKGRGLVHASAQFDEHFIYRVHANQAEAWVFDVEDDVHR